MTEDSRKFDEKQLFNRRSYLKATAAAVGLTAAGAAGAAGEDYEVIEVGSGETFRKRVSDGETWGNVLIDITARGAAYDIKADGSGWTIRNVGVRGTFDTHSNGSHFNVRVPDSSGTGVVENVYLPGASSPGHGYDGPTGIYVFRDHAGDVLIRNANIKRMQDNGIYASSPGHDASSAYGGTVRVENSYFEANAAANVRLGTTGSYAENCVMADALHRGYWAYYEHTELRNCEIFGSARADVVLGGSTYDKQARAEVTAENTYFGTVEHSSSSNALYGESTGSRTGRIPDGCPTSAEAAASGASGTSASAPEPYAPTGDFSLEMTTPDRRAEYLIELDADSVEVGSASNPDDETYPDRAFRAGDHWYVHGYTAGGRDEFHVTNGEILRVGELEGSTRIVADGRRVDPETFDDVASVPSEEGDDAPLPNVVVFDGNGTMDATSYEFVVSDAVEPSTDENATIDEAAQVDGTHASGTVVNYLDAWRFDGEIEQLSIDGDATVRVNGVEVDPDSFDEVGEDDAPLPNVVVFDGNGTADTTSYEFVVNNAVEPTTDENATVDEAAEVDGTHARGVVADYLDAWRFDSEIERLSVDGDATVRVNGVEVDPAIFDDV